MRIRGLLSVELERLARTVVVRWVQICSQISNTFLVTSRCVVLSGHPILLPPRIDRIVLETLALLADRGYRPSTLLHAQQAQGDNKNSSSSRSVASLRITTHPGARRGRTGTGRHARSHGGTCGRRRRRRRHPSGRSQLHHLQRHRVHIRPALRRTSSPPHIITLRDTIPTTKRARDHHRRALGWGQVEREHRVARSLDQRG